MIYTSKTIKAMKIACKAHEGQVDRGGMPYIYHPIHLAELMYDEASACVALLHDVVEDSDITFEGLKKEGFDRKIIDALKLLTHDKAMPYEEYISNIGENELATRVKLTDLSHNSDLSRLTKVSPKDRNRMIKYNIAMDYLLGRLNHFSLSSKEKEREKS